MKQPLRRHATTVRSKAPETRLDAALDLVIGRVESGGLGTKARFCQTIVPVRNF
jgi:hypothetical protein